jgi:hypothetical protein
MPPPKLRNKMATDYLEQRLEVGDTVVFQELHYRHFVIGIIEGITEQKVKIQYASVKKGFTEEHFIYQNHKQVIKLPNGVYV